MDQINKLLHEFKIADDGKRTYLFLYHRDMREAFQKIDDDEIATRKTRPCQHKYKTSTIPEDAKKKERKTKMDERMKSLIAIGASVTANCQPCIEYHFKKALELGIEKAEIAEAVDVAQGVRKGAANSMDKYTLSIIQKNLNATGQENATCSCCP